eukprot:gene40769-64339_t
MESTAKEARAKAPERPAPRAFAGARTADAGAEQ